MKNFIHILTALLYTALFVVTFTLKAFPGGASDVAEGSCVISTPGFPDIPCHQIWCGLQSGYSGCGMGNGLECKTNKSCPQN